MERMEHQHNYLATDSTVAHIILATIFAIVIVTIILIPIIIIIIIIIIIKSNHLAERRMLRSPWGEETYYGGLCSTPLSSCQARTNFSQPVELYTPRLYLHVKHAPLKGGFLG